MEKEFGKPLEEWQNAPWRSTAIVMEKINRGTYPVSGGFLAGHDEGSIGQYCLPLQPEMATWLGSGGFAAFEMKLGNKSEGNLTYALGVSVKCER